MEPLQQRYSRQGVPALGWDGLLSADAEPGTRDEPMTDEQKSYDFRNSRVDKIPSLSHGLGRREVGSDRIPDVFGTSQCSLIAARAFAFTHLAHFGLVFVAGVWAFPPLPALFWAAAMVATALVFSMASGNSPGHCQGQPWLTQGSTSP